MAGPVLPFDFLSCKQLACSSILREMQPSSRHKELDAHQLLLFSCRMATVLLSMSVQFRRSWPDASSSTLAAGI